MRIHRILNDEMVQFIEHFTAQLLICCGNCIIHHVSDHHSSDEETSHISSPETRISKQMETQMETEAAMKKKTSESVEDKTHGRLEKILFIHLFDYYFTMFR